MSGLVFEAGRGHFAVKRRKEQPVMRPGKTIDDALPVAQRERVKAYQARCARGTR